jgi:hypothetical protein
MSLPKQVQDQERRANEAIALIQQANQPAAPAAAEEAAPPPQAVVPEPDWKARYMTLKGKYDSEVPRLSELVRTQQEQIEALKRENEALKNRPPAADTQISLVAGLPNEVRERFDPDMIQLMTTIAATSAERVASEVRPAIERVEARDNQRAQELLSQQRQSEMLDVLNDLVPEWAQIDASEHFARYLQNVDPATGKPLADTLNAAVQQFDAVKAARIFRAYANSAPKTPAAPPPPSLAAQLVPDIAGAGSSAPAGDKRVYTAAEIKAMYAQSAGLVNSNSARAAEIEREIDLAHREGRIR